MSITPERCLTLIENENSLNLSGEPINENSLINVIVPFLKAHPEIKIVELNDFYKQKQITRAGLKALLSVPSIETLNLSYNQIDSDCAKALKHAKVSKLDISFCHFTDEMLDVLKGNEHITSLSIHAFVEDNKLTEKGVETLSTLPLLKHLEISSSTPGIDGCKRLAEMTLESLNLNGCGISPDMLSAFRDNNSLVELSLHKNPVGDKGMTVIPTMKKLKKLVATSALLTDTATISIANSQSLRDVNIFGENESQLVMSIKMSTSPILNPGPGHAIQHRNETHANYITETGQRTLAGNTQLSKCAVYFSTYNAGGYFQRWEDMDESPVERMNFAKTCGANPPIPSLTSIGMFQLEQAIKNKPELFSEDELNKLGSLFEEKEKEHEDRLNRRC